MAEKSSQSSAPVKELYEIRVDGKEHGILMNRIIHELGAIAEGRRDGD